MDRPFRMAWLVLCFMTLTNFGQAQEAQSPYNFNWKKDLIYSSAAAVFAGGGAFTSYQVRPLTVGQVNALDPYDLPGFDRAAVNQWDPKAKLASDILLYGSVTMPAFLMINKRMRKDFLVIGFIYAETGLLTIGVTELTKGLVKRPRPYAYNSEVDMATRTDKDARKSFFSGHTSITAALCFTTAKIFSDYSDNRTHKALVWTGAVIFPAVTGYLRYRAGKHFPSDIIAGYMVGATIGYLVPWLHRRKPLTKGLSIAPYSTGKGAGLYVSYEL